MVEIPILDEIACGDPITAEENISGYREKVADMIPGGELFYLIVKGNSMSPTIPDKNYVLIRSQPTVEDGEIAAVLVNSDTEATLKRVKHQGDLVLLVPDNKSYGPYMVTPKKSSTNFRKSDSTERKFIKNTLTNANNAGKGLTLILSLNLLYQKRG